MSEGKSSMSSRIFEIHSRQVVEEVVEESSSPKVRKRWRRRTARALGGSDPIVMLYLDPFERDDVGNKMPERVLIQNLELNKT